MVTDKEYISKLLTVKSEDSFNELALTVFQYQYKTIEIYKQFVDYIKVNPHKLNHYTQIPFLPIRFFKSHTVLSGNHKDKIFKSSGTGNMVRSNHYVKSLALYDASFTYCFEQFFGKANDLAVLCLLPSYQQQGDSSLVYMTDKLIQLSNNELSGYFLNDNNALCSTIQSLESTNQKYVLFGVSYALLDYVEKYNHTIKNGYIIETGGMKGRRKELTKEQLHAILQQGFGTTNISSEYGMTELLSQAYSKKDQLFETPNWMKVLIRETSDPFTLLPNNKTGLINIIDLANVHSCAFIATDDLGRIEGDGFKVLGRYDNTDVRGCNLLVQ